jgi:hypothetical protein
VSISGVDGDHGALRRRRRRHHTDGQFLETKEALGGYYLIDASDLEEAIKLASMLPETRAGHSGVDIRPVAENG